MSNPSIRSVIVVCRLLMLLLNLVIYSSYGSANYPNYPPNSRNPESPETNENSIEFDNNREHHNHVPCGTFASNLTRIVVKNPHHPEPTYTKAICETVIERANPMVKGLRINFRKLELYRPNYDGSCSHDRFGVYNDLNVAVHPIICGTQTGRNISVPFVSPQTSLIVSITTSDLDHDRHWILEIEQEK